VKRRPLRSACSRALAVVGLLLASRQAAAAPQDATALELAREAIEVDYLATDFVKAQQKLEKALQLCAGEACSVAVKAHIHRDLGLVLITGLKNREAGKQHFVEAFAADATITLDQDLATPEVQAAFDEARTQAGVPAPAPAPAAPEEKPKQEEEPEPAPPPPQKEPVGPVGKEDCPPNFPGCGSTGAKETVLDPGAQNWLSFGVQLDFMILGSTSGVCSGDSGYDCFFDPDVYYADIPIDRLNGQDGNEVAGGFKRATLRLLVGYDRFFGENFGVGARLGWAFLGGPQAPGGSAFLPIHGEARFTYVFGERPLASAGVRGFVHLSGGVAQVDTAVPVVVYLNQQDFLADKRTGLTAWKKSGFAFAALGGGVMYAITPNTGPYLDIRLMQMFGLPGTALSPQLGWTHGF